jgi:hypothetical protein
MPVHGMWQAEALAVVFFNAKALVCECFPSQSSLSTSVSISSQCIGVLRYFTFCLGFWPQSYNDYYCGTEGVVGYYI